MNKKELLLDWREIKFLQNIIICESCSGGILGEPLRIIPLFGTGTQEWIQPIPVDGFSFLSHYRGSTRTSMFSSSGRSSCFSRRKKTITVTITNK